jgi:2-polyprenyl-3-methyl-5-hydroxy-6-metoxy-1,4-benzoquinol methylase
MIYNDTLKKCAICAHVVANMQVDKHLLEMVYRQNYFMGEEYLDYVKDKAILQGNFARRLRSLSSVTTFHKGQRVLEIGCAYGFFGEVLLAQFPFVDYLGFDVVIQACEYAKQKIGLNVKCVDFLEYTDASKCAHVFMWDVIEHLNEPQRYIAKISGILEKGGKIYITTGDISAVLPRVQREKWRMIHPPSHLHYFSKKTLTMLLQKYDLRVVRVDYPAMARSLRQIYYSLFLLNKRLNGFKEFVYRHIPEDASISVNTYDIMLAVAEKT